MRKLTYFVATTVDGFIAGPQGQWDFLVTEGVTLRAQAEELPETLPQHARRAMGLSDTPARFDTVVMGRATYEPGLSAGFPHPYAPLRTVVFSRTLPSKEEGSLRITSDDPVATVRALKREESPNGLGIWLCGGGKLAAVLADEIDELVVKLNPRLTLGEGIRLFEGRFSPRNLTLRGHRTFDSGVIWLTYDLLPPR